MFRKSSHRYLGMMCLLIGSIVVVMLGASAKTDDGKSDVTMTEFAKVQKLDYPWGWIRWTLNAESDPQAEMTFGVVYIKPNQVNALHIHPNCAEYLHVVEGACEHLVGKTWLVMKAGDTVRIPTNVPHRARTRDASCRAVIVYNTGQRQMVPIDEDGSESAK